MITFFLLTILLIIIIDACYQYYISKKSYPLNFLKGKYGPNKKESSEEEWELLKESMALAQKKYNTPKKLYAQSAKYNAAIPVPSLDFYYIFGYMFYVDNYDELKDIYFNNGRYEFYSQIFNNSPIVLEQINKLPKVKNLNYLVFIFNYKGKDLTNYRRPKVSQLK